MRQKKKASRRGSIDKPLFVSVLVLIIFGLIAVADASAPQALNTFGDKYYFLKSQAFWAGLGFVVMLVIAKIDYKIWTKISIPLFFISLALLILVLIPGIGTKTYGARRWINLGFSSFQPSELVKLALIIYFAKLSDKNKSILSFLIPLGIVAMLIILQPDLGTDLVIIGVALIQIFLSGVNFLKFLGILVSGLVMGFVMIIISPYRKDRLMTFIEQTSDPLGKGYHIRQILLAIGSGGLFGVGIGASRQKYLFLPEAATDSIFAVIAEEVGFIGSLLIILLIVFLVSRAFLIGFRSKDVFARILACGIGSWIGIQSFINLASMTSLVPLTGIPLPFFSYGGTSLMMIMIGVGILLSISRYENSPKTGRN